MASQIDATLPVTGTPTTQSVRDNFAVAKAEITALQAAGGGGSGSGTVGSGGAGQFGRYASGGTTITGTSTITEPAPGRAAVGTVTDDGDSALQVGGNVTVYGSMTTQSPGPIAFQMYDTAAAVDQKRVDIFYSGTAMAFAFPDDAASSLNPWLAANRSGVNATTITVTAVTSINLVTPSLLQNGTPITSGGGSGTVGTGTANQFAYYSASGTAVAGTSAITQFAPGRIGVGGSLTDDGTNALQVKGSLSVLGPAQVTGAASVGWLMQDNSQPANQRNAQLIYGSNQAILRFINDDNSTGIVNVLSAARAGGTVTIAGATSINLVTPSLLQNGAPISGAGIGDAPSDGATYGRKNGAWAVAASGGASTPVLVNGSTIPATVGSPYVMQPTDYVVYVTSASAAYVTLPASPTIGATYRVLSPLTGVAAAPTTVAAPSGATLNGSGGFVQNSDADAMSYLAVSATVWRIV